LEIFYKKSKVALPKTNAFFIVKFYVSSLAMKIFSFLKKLWSEYLDLRDFYKYERIAQARKIAAQKKKEQFPVEVPQGAISLHNTVAENRPGDVNASHYPVVMPIDIAATENPQIEILPPSDCFPNREAGTFAERYDLARAQIRAGAEHVQNMREKIRSLNGAVVPLSKVGEAFSDFGPEGFMQRLEEVRARARERASARSNMEKKL
jgi:hypothetical protein